MTNSFILPLLLCVITIIAVHSQSLPDSTSFNPRSLSAEAEPTCMQTYGFLPCTTTVLGNLFLIIVYGHLMFVAANYLAGGSELQLKTHGPGVFEGLCLPIFGAFPGAMTILGKRQLLLLRSNFAIKFTSRSLNSLADSMAKAGVDLNGERLEWRVG
ncbi:hypothetical protein Q3G72_005512 [Acer saccharum]|nr:hypothetical protein Q3G72_005512 [Acer saccharum]